MAAVDVALLERIAEQRRFEGRTLEIAKRLFVHGETPKRLSVEYGINIQRVYAIRREVLAAADSVALPAGWEQLTVVGPKELIARVRRLVDEELAAQEISRGGPSTGDH